MESHFKRVLMKTFINEYQKKKYRINHKLQRKEDQWKTPQKSLLIDSIFRKYPVDPIRVEEKDDKIKYIFDGVQRSTTCTSYAADEFKLSNDLNPVLVDGILYDIAGKKYSELDEPLRDMFMGTEVVIYVFSDCTDQDIREMFYRQNNGTPLTNTQKRTVYETDNVSEIIYSLAQHPFFDKVLSKTQKRKDVARDLVRETLMLICSDDDNDFTSFRNKDIDSFVVWYDNHIEYVSIDILKSVLDRLDAHFEALKIKSTSIPMLLYAAYIVKDKHRSMDAFLESVQEFVDHYNENTSYLEYCNRGTTSSDAVKGRWTYWKNLVNELPESAESTKEKSKESDDENINA